MDCTGLTSVIIPHRVTSIDGEAFFGCTGLTSITLECETPPDVDPFATFGYVSLSNCTLYVPVGSKTAYRAAEGWGEFHNIVEYTFSPEVLATGPCGDNAIYTIYSDMSMVISGTGEMYDYDYDIHINDDYYQSIENVIIEDGVTSIGFSAFSNCTGLSSVTNPNSGTSFRSSAFEGCNGLASIVIPGSVLTIGSYAFSRCSGLTSLIISNGVESLLDGSFDGCTGLTSIEIPESVSYIANDHEHESVFLGCSNLESIIVDPNNSTYDSRDNCNAIIETSSNELIVGCKNTVIPEGVTGIIKDAFYGCIGLTSINIPSSLSYIGVGYSQRFEAAESPFRGCTNLSSITVDPNNGTYDSREDCNAIIETSTNTLILGCRSSVIPQGVTAIGDGAFAGCLGLNSLTIPNSVTSIGSAAFKGCTGLTSIIVEGETPANLLDFNGYSVFDGVDKSNCTLYVPAGSKSAYENAEGWSEFQNIVEIGEEPDTDISTLDNAIYVEQTEGRIGGTKDISVKMKNDFDVRGFQFTMELPEGTTINSWTLNQGRMPAGTAMNKVFATEGIDENVINVVCALNDGEKTFTGNDGTIATVNVSFAEDMEEGTYPIYLTNNSISDATAEYQLELSDIKSTLVLEDYVIGDTNGDGKVLVGDVIAILNYIVGSPSNNFNTKAADVNGDGKILVGDVIAVLNIIVNQ